MVSKDSKPKVLILSPGPRWDVVGEYTERLLALSQWIHPVLFTSGPEDVQIEGPGYSIFSFDIMVKKSRSLTHRFLFLVRLRKFILSRLADSDQEYIAIVSYDALATGIAGLLAKRLTGAPLICEINSNVYDKRLYTDFDSAFKRALRRLRNIAVSNFVLRRTDAIKSLYPDQLSAFPPEIQAKQNFYFFDVTDISSFYPATGTMTILAAGEPMYIKGFDLLIEAFQIVSPEFPEWELKIVGFFGDGKDIRARINEHKSIIWNGPINHSQMPEEMSQCSIFVLPSRSEGLPRVLLEAMAAGKPRISTYVGGIPETIQHGRDGLLVDPENIPALADSLRALMSDNEYREELGRNGRERVMQEFTMECYCEQYIDMINIVGRH